MRYPHFIQFFRPWFAVGLIALGCSGVALAQSAVMPGTSPNPTPDKSGPNAVDCSRATNKSLPDCSQDKGMTRTPTPGVDRGIQRDPPRTNDGMSGPATGAPKPQGDISEGKKDTTPTPR